MPCASRTGRSVFRLARGKKLLKKADAQASMLMNAYENPDTVGEIQRLWKSTFVQGDGNEAVSWGALKEVLNRSSGGKSFGTGKELSGTGERDPKRLPDIDANGAITVDTDPKKDRKVDGIYSQPQGELAIALEFGRVRRMADDLKNDIDNLTDFDIEERDKGEVDALNDAFNTEQAKKLKDDYDAEKNVKELRDDFSDSIQECRRKKREEDFNSLKTNFQRGRDAYKDATNLGAGVCKNRKESAKLSASAETIATKDKEREKCLESGLAAHAYSSPQMEAMDSRLPPTNSTEEEAGQRYSAAQSTGALARLYCLAIDVEIFLTNSDLKELASDNSNGTKSGSLNYVHVCATIEHEGCKAETDDPFQPPCTMTTIETNLEAIQNSSAFWPATMEEVYAVKHGCTITDYSSQVSGYLVSGEHLDCKDGKCTPRMELTSLDIRSASEQEIPSTVTKPEFAGGKVNGKVFHTAGLAILDRDIQRDKAKALARREGKKK